MNATLSNPHGLMATPAPTPADDTRFTYAAAAACVAGKVYDEALGTSRPAATLDDICDTLPEVMPEVFEATGTAPEVAAVLLPEVAGRLHAFTVIEHARADIGDYGYVCDVLADAIRRGADPQKVSREIARLLQRAAAEGKTLVSLEIRETQAAGGAQ
ncbi:hypothetical protein [Streptomyces sp. UG1]|uniref:hypothetical protein n=1 Tax=Streptomyces sp. UG1 TaxID=3417652 RepID=UPI003CF1BE06